MDKNCDKKIQTNYRNISEINAIHLRLDILIDFLINQKIEDRHLIKDLRKHRNRLEILKKKEIEFQINKKAYEIDNVDPNLR